MSERSATTTGILYVVATPIGNRDDLSLRALAILKEVDVILAEDTRHSKYLLQSLGIKKPMVSLHAHNEANKSEVIINGLREGKNYALISDAGTPLISDPGYPLVNLARKNQISVVPIPGACALITALSAAGVACDTFTFAGFLPAKHAARVEKLKSVLTLAHTLIFYESTHRILDSVDDIAEVFGATCELVLAKELTKTYERFITGTCMDVKAWLVAEAAHTKGEFVLIIPARTIEKTTEHEPLLTMLLAELPLKQAVKIASLVSGVNKNELYKIALDLQEK